jgi:hypothetical protein
LAVSLQKLPLEFHGRLRFSQVGSLTEHVNARRAQRVSIHPPDVANRLIAMVGGRNGKSSRRERTNRQVKETMAPAYGTKLYDRALRLGASIRGIGN